MGGLFQHFRAEIYRGHAGVGGIIIKVYAGADADFKDMMPVNLRPLFLTPAFKKQAFHDGFHAVKIRRYSIISFFDGGAVCFHNDFGVRGSCRILQRELKLHQHYSCRSCKIGLTVRSFTGSGRTIKTGNRILD